MANLASLIRDAERMRGPIVVAGAQRADPDEPTLETWRSPALLPSTPDLPSDAFRPRSPAAPAGAPAATIHLTEEQMNALRTAIAPPPEVMTLDEAARYLRLGRGSVLDLVHVAGMPAVKLAGKWRFKRSAVDHWFEIRLSG